MRCPNCGNEVGQDEAFCGQCGTPNMPPARPTEMVNIPAPRNGLPGTYSTVPVPSTNYTPGMQPPQPNTYNSGMQSPPTQPVVRPQQQSDFYQEPTEAMSALPGQSYPGGFQQGFPGGPGQGGYQTQGQPFQNTNYAGTGSGYPPSPTGYGTQSAPTPVPPKQQNSAILVIASVLLVIAILVAGGVGVIYLTRSHSSPAGQTATTPTSPATAAPTAAPTATSILSPTVVPSPSPTMGVTPTATPSPTPSPTVGPSPTPTPDPGFSWCATTTCAALGFTVEYPATWTPGKANDSVGAQFTNAAVPNEYAAFKNLATPTGTASDLVVNDLQTYFVPKTGYVPPSTPSATTTIGGETWSYSIAHYLLGTQIVRIEVLATVHRGKGYIIELQAADAQFDVVNTQSFQIMVKQFQFV